MYTHDHSIPRKNGPIVRRDLLVIGDRVVRIQTKQLSETIWIATGYVSPELPTGKHLPGPTEIRATGSTESEAIEALRHRILGMDHAMD
jgi:hypothetical protein